ncbi:electron transport complex subunit RsxC [Natronospora cellulosivora (SeqCode)]
MKNVKKFPIGGVHLPEEKHLTTNVEIKEMSTPDTVAIPLQQHIGAPCKPLVEVGQSVRRGECIAANDEGLSAKIHASISGVVKGIQKRATPDGNEIDCLVIEKGDKVDDEVFLDISKGDSDIDTIREIVKEAGIVGLGGACFPTHVKLNPPADKPIDTVLINGAECEPYITVDDRLMQEKSKELFRGLDLIMRTVGAKKGIIGCEINKPEALKQLNKEASNWENLYVEPLDTRYPHGAEKHLIKAILNREVPLRALPMEVKVVVNNVHTAISIAEAVDQGKSLTGRVLTVSGRGVKEQRNLFVPFGTSVEDVINFCGGFSCDNPSIILGGPMTGRKVEDISTPVMKGTSGIVVLNENEYDESDIRACIRCGKCVEVCPMYLSPNRIVNFVNNDMYDEAEDIGVNDCIECGACAFVCPSKRPLVRWIKEGKAALKKRD